MSEYPTGYNELESVEPKNQIKRKNIQEKQTFNGINWNPLQINLGINVENLFFLCYQGDQKIWRKLPKFWKK
jgi:hypothetical protein